jgi:hypothetical protein
MEGGGDGAASATRPPDFDQGYLSGRLGGVSVNGEATDVQLSQQTDCFDGEAAGQDCGPYYTELSVRVDRPDGAWGMTIIGVDGDLRAATGGATTAYVTGCSGPDPGVMDWDVPGEQNTIEPQADSDQPDTIVWSIRSSFTDSQGDQRTWWGGHASSPGDDGVVTTLIRLPR